MQVKKAVSSVDHKVHRRLGWALFDIQYEVYNAKSCLRAAKSLTNFSRIVAAKKVIDDNRNRQL